VTICNDALDAAADPAEVQVSEKVKLDRSGNEFDFNRIYDKNAVLFDETTETGKCI
jgi:hypothetical protein